jgi:hypothetical protein
MLVTGRRVGERSCGIGCGVVGDVGCEVSSLGPKGAIDARRSMSRTGRRYPSAGSMVENPADSGWRPRPEPDAEEARDRSGCRWL